MRRCVWSRNLKNGEAVACVGPQRHKKLTIIMENPKTFYLLLKIPMDKVK